MNPKVREAEAAMVGKVSKVPKSTDKDFLSTGVTLVNLAVYGRTHGGLKKGHIFRLVGGSSSAKTWLAHQIMAEASINKEFDDYELVYDDVERGALMDTQRYFGKKLVQRLQPPKWGSKGAKVFSESIGDFYKSLNDRLSKGKKVIWVEDSMDSLSPEHETKMGDGKAKINSQELRKLIDPLQETGSILILVSQTRVDMKSMFPREITSGGVGLEFYATAGIWLRKSKSLKVVYKGNKYSNGILIAATVKKNRICGSIDHTVYFPFHNTTGIDDIGANVDFLNKAGHWKTVKEGKVSVIQAPDINASGKRGDLIKDIETRELEREVQVLTGKVWREIMDACSVSRKRRYE